MSHSTIPWNFCRDRNLIVFLKLYFMVLYSLGESLYDNRNTDPWHSPQFVTIMTDKSNFALRFTPFQMEQGMTSRFKFSICVIWKLLPNNLASFIHIDNFKLKCSSYIILFLPRMAQSTTPSHKPFLLLRARAFKGCHYPN